MIIPDHLIKKLEKLRGLMIEADYTISFIYKWLNSRDINIKRKTPLKAALHKHNSKLECLLNALTNPSDGFNYYPLITYLENLEVTENE